MALTAEGYFNALVSYLAKSYRVASPEAGSIVLSEDVYLPGSKSPIKQKVRLKTTGDTLVVRLDKSTAKKSAPPLFHFLDDTAKPWSKRCDFVIFHRQKQSIRVMCIEFKSGSFPDSLVDQLEASAAWCRALHSVIRHYTRKSKRLQLTKYVFSCHPNPEPYLDAGGEYLLREHSIRHYHYKQVEGMCLDDLSNTNADEIR